MTGDTSAAARYTPPMFDGFLATELFAFLLLFTRVGTALMVMPGFGEVFVAGRIRLFLALALSLVLMPMLVPKLPSMPSEPVLLVPLIAAEATIGVFIGMMVRFIMSASHIAATIIATQSGLANAMMFDFTMSGQTTQLTNLLSFTAIVLVFSMDLHHAMIQAIATSYEIFAPGSFAFVQDIAEVAARYSNQAFVVALQMASPFIVGGIILNLGGGVLARLMPTFQVFFVLMSPQIMLAFFILMVTLSSMMLWYTQHVEAGLSTLFTP